MSSSTSSTSTLSSNLQSHSLIDKLIDETIDQWRLELQNSSKYGKISSITRGLLEENGKIKRPYEVCIKINVERKTGLSANIPASLDGIPVNVIETGRVIAA